MSPIPSLLFVRGVKCAKVLIAPRESLLFLRKLYAATRFVVISFLMNFYHFLKQKKDFAKLPCRGHSKCLNHHKANLLANHLSRLRKQNVHGQCGS